MTTKQIAHLKSLAMNLKPVLQVGKLGVHDSLIEVIEKHLDANELMKVSLLKNSDIDEQEFRSILISKGITIVSKIGRTLILYRYSDRLSKHLEF